MDGWRRASDTTAHQRTERTQIVHCAAMTKPSGKSFRSDEMGKESERQKIARHL